MEGVSNAKFVGVDGCTAVRLYGCTAPPCTTPRASRRSGSRSWATTSSSPAAQWTRCPAATWTVRPRPRSSRSPRLGPARHVRLSGRFAEGIGPHPGRLFRDCLLSISPLFSWNGAFRVNLPGTPPVGGVCPCTARVSRPDCLSATGLFSLYSPLTCKTRPRHGAQSPVGDCTRDVLEEAPCGGRRLTDQRRYRSAGGPYQRSINGEPQQRSREARDASRYSSAAPTPWATAAFTDGTRV